MVVIAWKKLLVAGVSGFACGKTYMWLKQYPETVRPILYCSALSGGCGVVVGLGMSLYRDLPSHVYALSTGANFTLITAAFLSIRHVLLRSETVGMPLTSHTRLTQRQAEFMSSGASGGIAVTMATILSKRGFRSSVVSGCVGVGLGLLSQLIYNRLEHWRMKKALDLHYPELTSRTQETEGEKGWKKFEARFMKFWHGRSRAIQTDTDIIVLTESIKMEQKRVKQLNKLLADKGVAPTVISGKQETMQECNTDTLTDSNLEMPQTR